jgi:hypothetical protein
MALTAKQRNALPRSAYGYAPAGTPRSRWKYPMPTAAQARKAGISEGQRQRTLRNAASRAGQRQTAGSYNRVAPVARRRSRGGGRTTTAQGWGRKRSGERRSYRRR